MLCKETLDRVALRLGGGEWEAGGGGGGWRGRIWSGYNLSISSLCNFLRPAILLPVSPVQLFFSVRSPKIIQQII